MSRHLRIHPFQVHDMISSKPEGLSGKEICIELINEVFAARDSRKFIQAAFPIPELKVDILDFMNQEKISIAAASKKFQRDKNDMEYFPEVKVSILIGSRGFRSIPVSY